MHFGQIIVGTPVNKCFPAVWFSVIFVHNIGATEKNYGQNIPQYLFDIRVGIWLFAAWLYHVNQRKW